MMTALQAFEEKKRFVHLKELLRSANHIQKIKKERFYFKKEWPRTNYI